MYFVISLLVLRAGCGIRLYQFLIFAYLFTLDSVFPRDIFQIITRLLNPHHYHWNTGAKPVEQRTEKVIITFIFDLLHGIFR